MKKFLLLVLIFIIAASFVTISRKWNNDPATIKAAVSKGISLIQPSDRLFLENAATCHSCHHQDLTAISTYKAKEKGLEINDTILRENIESITATLRTRRSTNAQHNDPVAIVVSGSYAVWALSETNYPSDKNIVMQVKNLMQRQTANGSWVSPNTRPPMEYYAFTATALVVSAIKNYAPAAMKAEAEKKIQKAVEWMMNEEPETNEEKAFQLLGLTWAHAEKKFILQQASKLISDQREDGGWSQLYSLESDAYATGQSLYALYECGALKPGDPAFEKGIRYLLQTQQADGSWLIQSRSFPSVPFVESGFPGGMSQFISAAGSNWAMMALLTAVEKGK